MHTFQIAPAVLDNYRNGKLTDERIDFLKAQATEQLAEIAQNAPLLERFVKQVNAPEKIDDTLLWFLFMSNEDICDAYIDQFGKNFREMIPVSDLADLLLYAVHLKKVKEITLDGFEYLMEYQHEGKDEVDQYCFMNVLLYVQKSKEASLEF
ncbi:MAG TPA: hypothetical protein ENL04_01875 [Sulfuricurvum sp.]|nr:hypothetical protein [Sulfuricurvum sp.]